MSRGGKRVKRVDAGIAREKLIERNRIMRETKERKARAAAQRRDRV